MGHTIATNFLPRNYCQTYSGHPRVIFCLSTGRRLGASSTRHRPFSWSERYSTSFLQHSGRRIHRILTQSATQEKVYPCRIIASVDELKMIDEWENFDQSIVL